MRSRKRRLSIEHLEQRKLFATLSDTFDLVDPAYYGAMVAEGESPYIGDEHDPFLPNFGHVDFAAGRRQIESAESGNWSSVFPTASSEDIIKIAHRVVISGDVTVNTIVVEDGGSLEFSTTANSSLKVVTLQVLEGGSLIMGTESQPIERVRAEIVFLDRAFDLAIDPGRYGHGLVAFGTVRMHGRLLDQTFVETATELSAGQTTISTKLQNADWLPGDALLIPDTRQIAFGDNTATILNRYDVSKLASLSGPTASLVSPLAFSHQGARDVAGKVVLTPYVANLSRTIVIRSENASGVRGHTYYSHHADVDIRYVEFKELGRTTNDALNNTVFSSTGQAVSIGTNQQGRYAVHFHHLQGPDQPQANGYQFSFVGNSVYSLGQAFKWSIAIHSSHYGLISQNVVYNAAGSGIATEDGSETGNVISENFVSRVSGTRARSKFTDGREGAGIWLRRPNSYLDRNVVSGAAKAAYAIFGSDNTAPPPIKIPAFQGADIEAGEYLLVEAETMVLKSFVGNVAFASNVGVELWYMGFNSYYSPSLLSVPETDAKDLVLWNIHYTGILGTQVNNWRFLNTRIYGDVGTINYWNYSAGIILQDANEVEFEGLIIENMRVGVEAPNRTGPLGANLQIEQMAPFVINGARLANYINVRITTPNTDAFVDFAPRSILLRNIEFRGDGRNVGYYDVYMAFYSGRFANLIQKDVVQVENYNLQGLDFQVYYNEQRPDFVVPQTGSRSDAGPNSPLGASLPNLTNSQAWEQLGVAIAGEVAPGGANHSEVLSLSRIYGLAFPKFAKPRIESISPDTGNANDAITSAKRLYFRGTAKPNHIVNVYEDDRLLGNVQADSSGKWFFDNSDVELADGKHTFRIRSFLGQFVSDYSSPKSIIIRSHKPELSALRVELYNDFRPMDVFGQILVTDADLGDTHTFKSPADGRFILETDGKLRVRNPAALRPDTTYSLPVKVTDSAGLIDEELITILVRRRPAGDWVTRLNYMEFDRLNAEEAQYLTPAQMASIPSAYWFARMDATARAALTFVHIQALHVELPSMISYLVPKQIDNLSISQVQTVEYVDFRYLTANRIALLSSSQVASIPDYYSLAQIPQSVRNAMTERQVQSLVLKQNMIAYLSVNQIDQLTPSQIRTLVYQEFRYLTPASISHLSSNQLASIPNNYWLAVIPQVTRIGLTMIQIQSLVIQPGMISYLSDVQRGYLTVAQIRRLTFADFSLLPNSQVLNLSNDQFYTIRDRGTFFRFSPSTIALLSNAGIRWVDGVGIVITRR